MQDEYNSNDTFTMCYSVNFIDENLSKDKRGQ